MFTIFFLLKKATLTYIDLIFKSTLEKYGVNKNIDVNK